MSTKATESSLSYTTSKMIDNEDHAAVIQQRQASTPGLRPTSPNPLSTSSQGPTSTTPSSTTPSSASTSTVSSLSSSASSSISPFTSSTSTSLISSATSIPSTAATVGPSAHHKHSGGHLSDGAVAGVAIGAAVVGALIAAAALYFLMKNRGSKHQRSAGHVGDSGMAMATQRRRSDRQPNGLQNSQVAPKALPVANTDEMLPQPYSDGQMKQEVEQFFSYVGDHVDPSLYHDRQLNLGGGSGQGVLPSGIASQPDIPINELLASPRTRFAAITSLVCAEMLAAIDFNGAPARSLLPALVTTFLRQSSKSDTSHAHQLSLSRWRTSTAYLWRKDKDPEDKARRDQSVELIIRNLDDILRPFVHAEADQKRRSDLVRICERAEQLGLLLLSQPATWAFEWSSLPRSQGNEAKAQPRRQSRKALVVLPALARLTDNTARALDSPRPVLEAKVLK